MSVQNNPEQPEASGASAPTQKQQEFAALREALVNARRIVEIEKMLYERSEEQEAGKLAIAAIQCLLSRGWTPPVVGDAKQSSSVMAMEQ